MKPRNMKTRKNRYLWNIGENKRHGTKQQTSTQLKSSQTNYARKNQHNKTSKGQQTRKRRQRICHNSTSRNMKHKHKTKTNTAKIKYRTNKKNTNSK